MNVRLLAAAAALPTLVLLQPYRPFVVAGDSMSPTFANGQLLVANVRPQALARGDVVVFRHNGETMVKRIAYLPGDSFERFWFNHDWQVLSSGVSRSALIRIGAPRQRWTVPQGSVYVLGDNPSGSIDSRTFGPVLTKDVLAIVPNVDPAAEWTFGAAHPTQALTSLTISD